MNFSFDSTLQIETERLQLRRFTAADAADMLKNWIADPAEQQAYGEPTLTTVQEVLDLLGRWSCQYRWAMVLRQTGEAIGHVSFCRLYEDGTAEVEYCIGQGFWGQGFTAEALRAFTRHTFLHTGIQKLEAFHRAENPASGRVLQKAGWHPVDNVRRFAELGHPPSGDRCYALTRAQDEAKIKPLA